MLRSRAVFIATPAGLRSAHALLSHVFPYSRGSFLGPRITPPTGGLAPSDRGLYVTVQPLDFAIHIPWFRKCISLFSVPSSIDLRWMAEVLTVKFLSAH